MSDKIDFKTMWKQQTVEAPSSQELLKKATQFKRTNFYKLVFTNIALLLTCITIGCIWYYYQPQFISTKIGIVLTLLAMVIFLIVYNSAIPFFTKNSNELTNNQYLQQLIKLKEKQRFLQTTMMNIYFLLLTTGICLYMYEYVSRMELIWGLVTYGITLVWIAFNWFFIRPRIINKQQTKINDLINQFNHVQEQLN